MKRHFLFSSLLVSLLIAILQIANNFQCFLIINHKMLKCYIVVPADIMVLQVSQQVAKPLYDAKVQPTTLIPKQIGNTYTASLYSALASLIHSKHTKLVIVLCS